MQQPRPPTLPDHPAYQDSYIWYVERDVKRVRVLHAAIEVIADAYERQAKPLRERWLTS